MKTIKISRYLVLGTLLTGFSALAAGPDASIKFTTDNQGKNVMKLDASGLSGSANYEMKVDSSSNGTAPWYVSDKNNSQWDISSDPNDPKRFEIHKDLSAKLIQPGQILIVVTHDNYNFNTHTFALQIPCNDSLNGDFASGIRLAMTDLNASPQTLKALSCGGASAPSQPAAPQPAPQPVSQQDPSQTTAQPAAPTGPSASDIAYAQRLATDEALVFVRKVVNTYGQMENYRYNLYRGFIANVNNITPDEAAAQTSQGYSAGTASGNAAGMTAGSQAGANAGYAAGSTDAQQRFESIINRNGNPDTSVPNLNPSIPGSFPMNAPAVKDVAGRLADIDAQVTARMQALSYTDDDLTLSYSQLQHPVSFAAMYNWQTYQAGVVESWYRSDWALAMYKNRDLGGNDNLAKYRTLCSTSQILCDDFDQQFKAIYDQAIDSRWDRAVQAANYPAYQAGVNYGLQAARGMAFDKGNRAGYSTAFQNSARSSYTRSYDQYYTSHFDGTVQDYENNAKIEGGNAQITDAQGTQNFVLGQPISVTIRGMRNAGRQKATLQIQITGAATKLAGQAGSVVLNPSSSMPDLKLSNIANLATNLSLGSNEVDVVVGPTTIPVSVNIDFRTQVMAMGATRSTMLAEYIGNILKTEWANTKGLGDGGSSNGGNVYDLLKPQNSYAGQLASAARSMSNPADKAFVKSQVNTYLQIYGKAPSGIWSPVLHKKWTAATGLLNQI